MGKSTQNSPGFSLDSPAESDRRWLLPHASFAPACEFSLEIINLCLQRIDVFGVLAALGCLDWVDETEKILPALTEMLSL
jgi:hypothetical protein